MTQPTQALVAGSQRRRFDGQAETSAVVHCTHEPALAPVVRQSGAAAEIEAHCALVVHGSHEREVVLQKGRVPRQSEFERQVHCPTRVSHTGPLGLVAQLASAGPGMVATVRPAEDSIASGRQSLSLSGSR